MKEVEAIPVTYSHVYFWGEGGQYGPFDVIRDGEWAGWPDFGQVMRYFRKKEKLSAKAFSEIYGKATNAGGSAVSERWILEMELENRVPIDINKRKTIARLLNIPPVLFGLAILEDIKPGSHLQVSQMVMQQTSLQSVIVDTSRFQNSIRALWQMHDTGNAQHVIVQIINDIRDLEHFEQQSQGDLRYHVQELLFGYHLLTTHVVRDQRQFSFSYYHANEAVRVARSMKDSDLLATALFTRGWTCLEWGLFGTIQQGVFQVQQDKLSAAIHDFSKAKKLFPAQDGKTSMHPQLLGRLTTYMIRAQVALAVSKGERVSATLLLAPDDVATIVGKETIDDLYVRVLVTGTRSGMHQAAYLTNRSTIFTTAGLAGNALQELNTSEKLTKNTYRRDETRQFTWLDILKANVYMGLGEFDIATDYAKRALLACQDIKSVTNIAIITDIHGRLVNSSYRSSGNVQDLGDILRSSDVSLKLHEN